MIADPGIARNDSSSRNLDTHVRTNIAPRWNGGNPDKTAPRARGTRYKRDFQNAIRRGIPLYDADLFVPGEKLVQLEDVVSADAMLELCVGVIATAALKLRPEHLALLARCASSWLLGGAGVVLSHKHVAAIVGKSEPSAERYTSELVGLALLVRVSPMFELHGPHEHPCTCDVCLESPSSQRAWAYALAPALLGGIACASSTCEEPSGTVSGLGREAARSSQRSRGGAQPPLVENAIVPKNASARAAASAPKRLPREGGAEPLHVSVWRELAAKGDELAAEALNDYLARKALEDVEDVLADKVGRVETADDYSKRRDYSRRCDLVEEGGLR